VDRSYSIGTALGAFVESEFYGGMWMFQRLYPVHEVTQETKESAIASKVAAIVATLTIPTIALTELDCGALPTALKAQLVGYLQGFCVPICVAWQVDDTEARIAAIRLVVASIFPENPALFLKLLDGMSVGSDAFRNGIDAGRRDGELYSATGRRGTALLQILASDFRAFCNHSKFAANVPGNSM
jgi:hypothetical protein